MSQPATPQPNPRAELDACGVGFVARTDGRASREIVDLLLHALRAVRHRGAAAADPRDGDGAGLLLPLAPALQPEPGCGLAMVFGSARAEVEAACAAEGLRVSGWREVPIEPDELGPIGRASLPAIEQAIVARPDGVDDEELERRCLRARKRVSGAYVASLSFRTVTYKALCAADRLGGFYPDLRDPALAVPFGIFHQRFSTNTTPSWERAQPFRLLCHNGEINAIAGNVNWMRAREGKLGSDDDALLAPVIDESGSDSAMLDNVLELLVRYGRDVRHAITMMVPPAWEGDAELDPELRDFYRFHSGLIEPWDGPAALVFTDGRVVGAALDRNGLRPLRYASCEDGLVVCASEAGLIPLEGRGRIRRGRLGPGQLIALDPERGLELDATVKRGLAARRPYGVWLEEGLVAGSNGEPGPAPEEDVTPRQAVFGYSREELMMVLRRVAQHGHEPTSSMGDDTALPPLAGRARPLYSYFRQRFAQVTNPPVDHLRERHAFSLRTLLGARGPLLHEGRENAAGIELESFFLYPDALDQLMAVRLDATFACALVHNEGEASRLEAACRRLADEAEEAVRAGAGMLLLSDRGIGPERAPVPALLATGAVHHRLVQRGLRTLATLVVETDEAREAHHVACLLGYGAEAVCPRLALETVAAMAAADKVGGDRPDPEEAQQRLRHAVEDGVLKIMSKMGICDVASYCGAQVFETLGLGREVVELCFPGTPAPVGGIGFAELEAECLARLEQPALANPGYVKYRKGGEPHGNELRVVKAAHALRFAHAAEQPELYERFAALVNERAPIELRDLLELRPGEPVPLDEVEPAAEIVRRFSSGGMSHGSLSAEAHQTIAAAFNRLQARSNCGEGGEDPGRFRDERNSKIKQIASGRFGVTPEYAAFAEELQIKIAQGAKPGEGGQLPGHKVSAEIARLRHTQPGVALISPPPHHDIYSIEDLAQLIFDLRQVSPQAAISVKLVAETGVGLVAAGVAKALADVVHIAGADGGTGASPLTSIKNAGMPWELGLVETQHALIENGLRGRVRLRVDGGIKTGLDVVKAALLGADEISFGTVLLLVEGCLMVRSCHLDTCPVGIATQRPELRAKFEATPEMIERYLLLVAEEARRHLAALGLRSLGEAVGRVDLLVRRRTDDPRCEALDLAPLLAAPAGVPLAFAGEPLPSVEGGALGERLAEEAAPALAGPALVEPAYAISTDDRTVGARLGGVLGRAVGASAPPGRVRARLTGAAGQSFGAFLAAGVALELTGEANDYVGKSMSGGRIAVRPPAGDEGRPVLIGNTALYGATGGELFCAGSAGERFAVRNSGAVAVVEGVGDHACEYMTNGTVVVLGPVGRNLGAGMTGGRAFVHDRERILPLRLNAQLVSAESLDAAAAQELRRLVERHLRYTGSARASELLAAWEREVAAFWLVQPRAEVARLESQAEGTEAAGEEAAEAAEA